MTAAPPAANPSCPLSAVNQALLMLQSDELSMRVEAAKDIRRLTKTSPRYRRHLSAAVSPLVGMLRRSDSADANEAALAALLNLAVKDERNKVNIIEAGALGPIISFLQSENPCLNENSAAALVTLSASPRMKPIIISSGAIPPLIGILSCGGPQAKLDALTALHNLSTHRDALGPILGARPIPPLDPGPRSEGVGPDELEEIVRGIVSGIEGEEQLWKAKRVLAEMVQVSMERSLKHLQKRASLVCAPADFAETGAI
ncbi:ARM repeat superfamily protein [Striga hermonthica]|uniref:ARM repeat superfamily protein n=1 Tax=Striga hermonthica TaxID=68872 RepID=A0A9N7MVN7_STRHE|nr:ARM repeat superfamily protein [Striga hermonthica]